MRSSGLRRRELPRRLDAGHPRHAHVEDRQIDVVGERALDRLGAVGGLGDDLEVGLARRCTLPQAGAHDRVVVGDEDPRDERDRHQARCSAGTSSRTSTPPVARRA